MLRNGLGCFGPERELLGLQLLRGLGIGKGAVDGDGADFDLGPDKVAAAVAECVHVDLGGCVVGHVASPFKSASGASNLVRSWGDMMVPGRTCASAAIGPQLMLAVDIIPPCQHVAVTFGAVSTSLISSGDFHVYA